LAFSTLRQRRRLDAQRAVATNTVALLDVSEMRPTCPRARHGSAEGGRLSASVRVDIALFASVSARFQLATNPAEGLRFASRSIPSSEG
jgi:hypothetical protein